jgi:serine/threonine protein kinase
MREFYTYYCHKIAEPEIAEQIAKFKAETLAQYGEVIRTINTNLGHVFITQRHHMGVTTKYAVKVSRISYSSNRIVDDPALEARWYHIVSKDGNPSMMGILLSLALGKEYICVTPCATMGDLFAYLTNPNTDKLKLKDMYLDLLYAICYMHNHLRVAHLDLKPENIFIGDDHQVVVGDMGVCTPIFNDTKAVCYQYWNANVAQEVAQIRAAGYDEAYVQKRVAKRNVNFEQFYHLYDTSAHAITNALGALIRDLPSLLDSLGTLKVPISLFFMPHSKEMGLTSDIIYRINGYRDCDIPNLEGDKLVQSFIEYLGRIHPNDYDAQKARVREYDVTLKHNLPARLYCTVLSDGKAIKPQVLRGSRGTKAYMCPKMMMYHESDPFAADVYSMGVVLFICATGFPPYKESHEKAFKELEKGGVRHLLKLYGRLDSVDSKCIDLLEKMMNFDPEKRPSVMECIELFKDVTLKPFAVTQ